jgi:outer membrane protein TolC
MELKMQGFLRLIYLILIVMVSSLFSQTGTDEILRVTLEKSVDMAIAHNPTMKVAEKELEKAEADVTQAYSTILPQLDARINFQHAWAIQESTIPNFIKPMLGPLGDYIEGIDQMPDYVRIAFGRENTLTYGLMLTQPLFLGGAGLAGIKLSKASLRAAEYNLESKRQQLIYLCVDGFYSCLLAQKVIAVQEEAMKQAQANLDVVLKKYNVGAASGFDKMRAEVEVANLKPELINARNNYQVALTRLRAIIGLNRDSALEISGEFLYEEDDFGKLPLSELQDIALKNRPDMLTINEQKQISQQGINIARSDFMPKIIFTTDYSYLAMKDDLKFAQRDFSKGFTSGITLQLPLFNGLKNVKQYQKAYLDYYIIQDTEKQLIDAVYAEVEVALNNYNEARQKYMSSEETVALAQESLRLANLMYEEGANTQLDVLVSRLSLTQAQMNYYSSLYQYQIARYQLRKVTGQTKGIL